VRQPRHRPAQARTSNSKAEPDREKRCDLAKGQPADLVQVGREADHAGAEMHIADRGRVADLLSVPTLNPLATSQAAALLKYKLGGLRPDLRQIDLKLTSLALEDDSSLQLGHFSQLHLQLIVSELEQRDLSIFKAVESNAHARRRISASMLRGASPASTTRAAVPVPKSIARRFEVGQQILAILRATS